MRAAIAFLLSVCVPAMAAAQNPFGRLGEVRREIVARNATRALSLLDTLSAAAPHHPNMAFLRAHAYGVAGRLPEAAHEITTLLRWDPRYARSALRDSSVAALRAQFAHVDSLAAQAERQLSRAYAWATLAERDLIAEGTAYDPGTRSVLIGSLNKHKVVAIAPDGSVSDRVPAGSNGLRSVVGMHVDSSRGVLWVASNARYDTPADSTPSMLYAFDARTGAYRSRLPLPTAGPHFLNDVTTGPDGTVYVTDTRAGRVWVAPRGATELRELGALGTVIAPNGITITPDGRLLFVADIDHVRVLEIPNGSTWRLAVPDTFNVSGIDGLAYIDGTLIAHHPLSYWKVARYELDADRRRIVGRTLIEANTPDGRTSTTGEIVGGDYVFIGNSQIDRMNARTIDASTMDPIRIYRVKIEK